MVTPLTDLSAGVKAKLTGCQYPSTGLPLHSLAPPELRRLSFKLRPQRGMRIHKSFKEICGLRKFA